ncbi:MAG: MFS transporter, partial [Clostridia bacterium]|nr:MFS transporter [Clostridia bacterium]
MKILKIRSVIATIFLSLCIGQVYSWSLLSKFVNETLNNDMSFAFSLAILFLGFSAAFMGKVVERNPKLTYILSIIFFVLGFLSSGFACSIGNIPLFYLSYGVFFGISCGLGYCAPIKTLMLYFRHNKAVGSSIAILSFGLAKSFSSPLYTYLTSNFNIEQVFYILTLIYTIPLIICAFLFKKFPVNYKQKNVEPIELKKVVFTKEYICIWLFFFLTIACGLAFISQEAQLYQQYSVSIGLATVFCAISAAFNAFGRFGFAWISDKTNRYVPYFILFTLSAIACLFNLAFSNIIIFVISVMIINGAYGGNFSSLPSLLASKYGIANTSSIHSFTLCGWGIAGIASLFLKNLEFNTLLIVCFVLYL